MKMRKCVCPTCKSLNTRNWKRRIKMGFKSILEVYPDSDQSDYVVLAQTCDDCGAFFYTKAKVKIQYIDEQDILLDDGEAIGLGIK